MNVVLYFQSRSNASTNAKLVGVQDVAEKTGWLLQVVAGIPTRRQFIELVEFWKPIGCIAECGGEGREIDPQIFAGLPTVFFDHDPSTLPRNAFSVSHDSIATGTMAARELLMSGYEHFAFIHPAEAHFWSRDRELGFAKALKTNGKHHKTFNYSKRMGTVPRGKMGTVPNIAGTDSIEFQRQLRAFLGSVPTPCAVFAANDRTAAEVLSAIHSLPPSPNKAALSRNMGTRNMGTDPISQFAVIGVDNFVDICEHTTPKLTSIEADFRGGGNTAALMLLAIIRSNGNFIGERQRTFGPSRIVRRASTRNLWIRDSQVNAAMDMIAAKACLGLTAKQVLANFNCSRDMAEIRFRKATGTSVLSAIHEVRLARAKTMLRNPLIQIKAIADFCGFRNQNSLRKFFRRKTGMSMSKWRQTKRDRCLPSIPESRVSSQGVTIQ